MLGISACSRLQVLGNTKYSLYSCTGTRITVQLYSYSTARTMAMYGLLHTKSYQYLPVTTTVLVQVLGNTLKLGVR